MLTSSNMYKEIIEKIKPELEKTIDFLTREIDKIRVSKPSISLIEDLKIEYFDQTFVLKQLGSMTLAQGRQIVIQPWDKSYISAIEKAVEKSSFNFAVSVKEDKIFLSLPPLTSEYRQELLKVLSEKEENSRQTIRHWREDAWRSTQELFSQKKISEDDKFKAKDELQDLVDEYNKKVKELIEKKKKELAE